MGYGHGGPDRWWGSLAAWEASMPLEASWYDGLSIAHDNRACGHVSQSRGCTIAVVQMRRGPSMQHWVWQYEKDVSSRVGGSRERLENMLLRSASCWKQLENRLLFHKFRLETGVGERRETWNDYRWSISSISGRWWCKLELVSGGKFESHTGHGPATSALTAAEELDFRLWRMRRDIPVFTRRRRPCHSLSPLLLNYERYKEM